MILTLEFLGNRALDYQLATLGRQDYFARLANSQTDTYQFRKQATRAQEFRKQTTRGFPRCLVCL